MSITVCQGLIPLKHRPPQHRELFYEIDTRRVYYYNENEEKYIMLTYLDYMGYDYFETLFKKTPPKEKKENKRQNCVNCGAPLTYGDVCEYCGTIH